ncbi:hypothetical protein F7725_026164 [Dissostichus mawsoni]|uniref:Uncharacterized protein n=1 Tax=Dissostichus mawsoni TaxID=36200 RepID=A0A7J5X786_DISMA|nr:hypothetical protein F7725_026164 [Dissostichus mawsoni]
MVPNISQSLYSAIALTGRCDVGTGADRAAAAGPTLAPDQNILSLRTHSVFLTVDPTVQVHNHNPP